MDAVVPWCLVPVVLVIIDKNGDKNIRSREAFDTKSSSQPVKVIAATSTTGHLVAAGAR